MRGRRQREEEDDEVEGARSRLPTASLRACVSYVLKQALRRGYRGHLQKRGRGRSDTHSRWGGEGRNGSRRGRRLDGWWERGRERERERER